MGFSPIRLLFSMLLIGASILHADSKPGNRILRGSQVFKPSPTLGKFKIEIFQSPDNQWLRILSLSPNIIARWINIPDFERLGTPDDGDISFVIEIGDYNFDGYLDFAIEAFSGGTGNHGYYYFLFHPDIYTFKYHKDWNNLYSPNYYPDSKLIRCHWNRGGGLVNEVEWFKVNEYSLVAGSVVKAKDGSVTFTPKASQVPMSKKQ